MRKLAFICLMILGLAIAPEVQAQDAEAPAAADRSVTGGAQTLELNLEPSEGSHFFTESRHGPAGTLVPQWVEEVLHA